MVENCFSSGMRHRGGHGVRAGAGQGGADHDRGKIDVGQIADRQQAIAHDAEDQDAGHDQRGHDRPLDEDLGDIHDRSSCAPVGRGLRTFGPLEFNLGARQEANVAVGDDGLAGGHTLLDHELILVIAGRV